MKDRRSVGGQMARHSSKGNSIKDNTVKAAVITAVATVLVSPISYFLGVWHFGSDGKQTSIPLSISITSPSSTVEVPQDGTDFTAEVKGFKPGQTVWIFSKQMTNGKKPINTGVVTMNEGPCDVSGDTWNCQGVKIGGSNPQDAGKYRVWAAVLSPGQVRDLEYDLAHNASIYGSKFKVPPSSPPGVYPGGLFTEEVTRL
jgi:hypothetical protein